MADGTRLPEYLATEPLLIVEAVRRLLGECVRRASDQ
jgi:hypothetical protein